MPKLSVANPPEGMDDDPNKWLLAESTRLTVLYCLALMALFVGVFIAITAPSTGPSFNLFGKIPGWPQFWGVVLSIAGGMQLSRLLRHSNKFAAIGCSIAFAWRCGPRSTSPSRPWRSSSTPTRAGSPYWSFGAIFFVQWALWATGPQDSINPSNARGSNGVTTGPLCTPAELLPRQSGCLRTSDITSPTARRSTMSPRRMARLGS